MLKLFDDTERTEDESAGYAEPNFTYLNRTARVEFAKIRNLLEEWFERYPSSDQKDLRNRFRSPIDHQHQAAFFELFLHELLFRLGCNLITHPSIEETTKIPDFLVEPKISHTFYLEATVATGESASEVAARTRENNVYDVLNRLINSPDYFLWVKVNGRPPSTPPPAKKLASFISSQLDMLNYDEITAIYELDGYHSLPLWHFEHEGWKIDIRPTPKTNKARGKKGIRPIGMKSTGFEWVDHRTPIRDSIIKKGRKYGELNLPYVVAVNATELVDETDIMEALYGKEQYSINFADNKAITEPKLTRIPDGAWVSGKGPRYTRVSAVLIVSRLTTWNIPRANIRLYHNPWAKKPYNSVLTRLNQAIPKNGEINFLDGENLSSLLELSSSWPENTA